MTGTVLWFDDAKGFGFIAREGEHDLFVHARQVNMLGHRTLVSGEQVTFDIETDASGRQYAANVNRI